MQITDHRVALTNLDTLVQPHRYGHRCYDGKWYDPHLPTGERCATLILNRDVYATVEHLAAQPHVAAHDQGVALRVGAEAMGFSLDEATSLTADDLAGILAMGQRAGEALAEELDPDVAARRAAFAAAAGRFQSGPVTR